MNKSTVGENVLFGNTKFGVPKSCVTSVSAVESTPLKFKHISVAFNVTPVVFVIVPENVTRSPGCAFFALELRVRVRSARALLVVRNQTLTDTKAIFRRLLIEPSVKQGK